MSSSKQGPSKHIMLHVWYMPFTQATPTDTLATKNFGHTSGYTCTCTLGHTVSTVITRVKPSNLRTTTTDWLPGRNPSHLLRAQQTQDPHGKTQTNWRVQSALKNLRKNPEIMIKPYDKGRGICIMNRSHYLQVGYKHLESEHYTELDQVIPKPRG